MSGISTGVGLISGINSAQIIDQLIAIEARPRDQLTKRVEDNKAVQLAYTQFRLKLTSLRTTSAAFRRSSTFTASQTNSSNTSTATATASSSAAVGTYSFQVARLTTTQQAVSRGYASTSSTAAAGTLTFEVGGGEVTSQTTLAQLNGGAGVRRGNFRITDRSGAAATIDIASAVTLDDVAKRINTALNISVRATVSDQGLVLEDLTGQTASNLTVADLGGGSAAADLGIAGTSAGTSKITGAGVYKLTRNTLLSELNDGRGIRFGNGTDFQITLGDGSLVNIDLTTQASVGDVLDSLNAASPGKLRAEIDASGNRLKLYDDTGSTSSAFAVTTFGTSSAASDLGLLKSSNDEITGDAIFAGANTVLLSSLKGGTKPNLGIVEITNRAGASSAIDFSNAASLADVLKSINGSGLNLTARVNKAGNGIEIVDNSSGAGQLQIGDLVGNTAAFLNVSGVYATGTASSGNLQRKWLHEGTLLSELNGGRGVSLGRIRITGKAAGTATIDLAGATRITDVLKKINDQSSTTKVSASINANGDGILLTDTSGGAAALRVEDLGGTTARDLGIAGVTATTATTLNGSFEKTISVLATDKLSDIQKKINDAGLGVSANLVNDGSSATPVRFSLTARDSGRNGRFIFDAGSTGLDTTNLVEAQNAAVFLGSSAGTQPLLITSSSNSVANVIQGVTLDLHSASENPVTITVTRTPDQAIESINKFVEDFNALSDEIRTLTTFDTETNERGLLLGDATTRRVTDELFGIFNRTVAGAGRYRVLSEVGLRVGPNSQIEFDEDKFRRAYSTDAQSVEKLFTAFEQTTTTTVYNGATVYKGKVTGGNKVSETKVVNGPSVNPGITNTGGSTSFDNQGNQIVSGGTTTVIESKLDGKGFGYLIEQHINRLIDPVDGAISREDQNINTRNEQLSDRITQLNFLLDAKKLRLQRQFAQMESVLAQLQSQGSSLSSITTPSTSRSN